jgi:5-methyltetrahydropteroyltriglutamate--homocysteine methyltransferase
LIKGGFPSGKYLFAGVVDGRNIWANDLASSLSVLHALEGIVGKGINAFVLCFIIAILLFLT